MQNLNQMLTETVFLEQTGKINAALTELLIAKGGRMKPTSWAEVQRMVRDGTAAKVFSIGDQLTCQRGNDTLVWDVIGIDHDTPTDPQFTHSLTLQLHDCFSKDLMFDAPEALFYCESALPAGTYHFAADDTNYQFEIADEIPAGSQLILISPGGIPNSISVSSTKGGTSSGSISVTSGNSGDELIGVNTFVRTRYGNNNYKQSAIRQWLNSDKGAGLVWTPQNNFDRPPSWASDTAGFLYGMDADFLSVIGSVSKATAKDSVDGGGVDVSNEKFFLLSRSEAFGGTENSSGNEGAPYPYYSDYSDLKTAGMGSDSNRIKYYNGVAKHYWLRTPLIELPHNARFISATGSMSGSVVNAVNYGWISPACNII